MIDLDLIENFSIDKSDWITFKFGDIVYEPKESVKDPIAEGIEHVVGLEHIDSENIHLRRSASIEESTTFTKRFRKDDVLFGRRRAYLKKAAKANFDGICSGDITVMRAKEELLSPNLLPFIVNNDKFFDFAVEHSAGGLSPRVKFKDLANYEVLLPSVEDQAILVNFLFRISRLVESDQILLERIEKFKLAKMIELLNGYHLVVDRDSLPNGWQKIKLKDVAKFIDYRGKTPKKTEEGVPLITAKNIRNGWLDREPREFISDADYEPWMRRGIPRQDDVLFTTEAPLGNTAIVEMSEKFALAQRVICLQPNDSVYGRFLFYALNNPSFKNMVAAKSSGTTVSGIRAAYLKEIQIVVPPLSQQVLIVEMLDKISKNCSLVRTRRNKSQSLMKNLAKRVV